MAHLEIDPTAAAAPLNPDAPIVSDATSDGPAAESAAAPSPRRRHRVTDLLQARYRFPDDEPLVRSQLSNGVVVTSPVIVEADLGELPGLRLRFEAEEGKFLITRCELVRTTTSGITAATVRDLPLAPVFKAIRARLVTAFAILEQLEGRAVEDGAALEAHVVPASPSLRVPSEHDEVPAFELEATPAPPVRTRPVEAARAVAATREPSSDDSDHDATDRAAPDGWDDFLAPTQQPVIRSINRPAARHLAAPEEPSEQAGAGRDPWSDLEEHAAAEGG